MYINRLSVEQRLELRHKMQDLKIEATPPPVIPSIVDSYSSLFFLSRGKACIYKTIQSNTYMYLQLHVPCNINVIIIQLSTVAGGSTDCWCIQI